jgi:hypothetical protein
VNYFFHAWLQQSSDMEVVVLGSMDIFLQSRPIVDPYFYLLMSGPPVQW